MKRIDAKEFLKTFRLAMKELKPNIVLESGYRLRFVLREGDGARYCPITLVCIHQKGIYYDPSYEVKKAAKLIKVRAQFRERINSATDRDPGGYDRRLRRNLMRATGRWK